MYNACFFFPDSGTNYVTMNGEPAVFETEEEVWKFINATMSQAGHPLFMWARKI